MHFKDFGKAKEILSAKRPEHQKKLGREVKDFDDVSWNRVCEEVVIDGNRAKVI